MQITFPTLANFRKHRAEKKLASAIVDAAEHSSRNPKKMEEALQRMDEALKSGARQIDYLMWRDGDRPKERVPAGKFSDPVTLARAIGLPPRGMAVLQQHGLIAADEPLGPKTPRR